MRFPRETVELFFFIANFNSFPCRCLKVCFDQVLDYCNASPQCYKCIFTSGATAALKLVGEAFPWSQDSCFMYTTENHNSVLGIREYPTNIKVDVLIVEITLPLYWRVYCFVHEIMIFSCISIIRTIESHGIR